MKHAGLALGPNLFNWSVETWRDFYFRIADEAPVDTVYLGETVCSKREPFFAPYIPDVVERLQGAGKQVIVSTLSLIMSSRELKTLRETAAQDDLMVEANDVSALSLLKGRPHVIGPLVNVYNEGTLAFVRDNGAVRVALPVELSIDVITALACSLDTTGPELEVFAYGRLPLAISARCYHARAHDLSKDGCQYVCAQDADGLDVDTLDGDPFLAVNGVQTLSYTCCNLIHALTPLQSAGVRHFRISPHSWDMVAVARCFRDVLDGRMDSAEGAAVLDELSNGMPISDGYLYGREGVSYSGDEVRL